jgi:hypothetical protein
MDSCCRLGDFIFGSFQLHFNMAPDGLCKPEGLEGRTCRSLIVEGKSERYIMPSVVCSLNIPQHFQSRNAKKHNYFEGAARSLSPSNLSQTDIFFGSNHILQKGVLV